MSTLQVDPAVGLPSGNPVAGSVRDGVSLPYALDLKGAGTARLVLTFDGTTVAEVAAGRAQGVLNVPAQHPALHRADGVVVVLTALDPAGATIARATTKVCVADGAALPATIKVFGPDQPAGVDVADGDTVYVTVGDTVRVHALVASGTAHIPVTTYALDVAGTSILDDPVQGAPTVWVTGTWTVPSQAGAVTMVLSAQVEGDSATQQQTFTMQVQPGGRLVVDGTGSMLVDPGSSLTLAGTLKVDGTYQPVPDAPIEIWWQAAAGTPWTRLDVTATTGADGRFSLALPVTASGSAQVHCPGKSGVVGPTSSAPVPIAVQANVVLSVDRTAASPGTTLRFTVAAAAAMAGTHSLLQLWNGLYWTTVGMQPLDAKGGATLTYTVAGPGSYKFEAFTGYGATFAPTESNNLTVTVR